MKKYLLAAFISLMGCASLYSDQHGSSMPTTVDGKASACVYCTIRHDCYYEAHRLCHGQYGIDERYTEEHDGVVYMIVDCK